MRFLSIGFVLFGLAVTTPVAAATVPTLVDTCGQVLPAKAAGFLAADLDCSSHNGPHTLELGKRASLDLGGFTLTTGSGIGISCPAIGCAIRNGTVTGAGYAGIVATRALVENVTLTMSGTIGASLDFNSTVRGSTIDGASAVGVYSINGKKKVTIVDSVITNARRIGVQSHHAVLIGSTVAGNMTDPECLTGAVCVDLRTARRPKLKDSSCGRSDSMGGMSGPGCLGWCVCADD